MQSISQATTDVRVAHQLRVLETVEHQDDVGFFSVPVFLVPHQDCVLLEVVPGAFGNDSILQVAGKGEEDEKKYPFDL